MLQLCNLDGDMLFVFILKKNQYEKIKLFNILHRIDRCYVFTCMKSWCFHFSGCSIVLSFSFDHFVTWMYNINIRRSTNPFIFLIEKFQWEICLTPTLRSLHLLNLELSKQYQVLQHQSSYYLRQMWLVPIFYVGALFVHHAYISI